MNNKYKTILAIYSSGILYDLIYAMFLDLPENAINHGIFAITLFNGLVFNPLMPFVLDLYRRLSRLFFLDKFIDQQSNSFFNRYESYTYAVVPLATLLFFTGIKPSFSFTLAVFIFFAFSQIGLLIFSLDNQKTKQLLNSEKYIAILFLISGFSALIYQVVWQRILFTTFGVNSESVTVIVSVFMFGLGIGSLLGGYLQQKFPNQLLSLFLALEVSIGLFGLGSIYLIYWIANFSATESLVVLLFRVYAVLAIPTLLMGATLPILVAFLQNYFHNIGKTVGLLYAFNTIGSAIAAFLTVEILFVFFGQQTTVVIAACCNFMTAYLIFKVSRQLNPKPPKLTADFNIASTEKHLPYPFVFIALLAIGYISLSQEILWFRLLGYMSANRPQIFGLLLAAFLIGIALGSLKAKKYCEAGLNYYRYIITAVFFTALAFYLAIPVISYLTAYLGKLSGFAIAFLLIALVAYFSGSILPILMHTAIDEKNDNPAASISWFYFANILGATGGPLLTGFILLDQFSLELNIVILSTVTLFLLLSLLLLIPESTRFKLSIAAIAGCATLIAILLHPIFYREYLEKIQYASTHYQPFKYQLENRSGILTVEQANSDIMYGNGIYDGRFNIDLLNNSNMIDRAYMIAALHRQPKKILEIGLSTGSWARIISDYSPLEQLTIIEINKGYPKIIQQYPEIAKVFTNPKVQLFFDDGRRWLRNHPEQKFDLIVMNTTFHWRSSITNLLSAEFLQLCKHHLNKSGVIYYNTTGSKDIPYTTAQVFNYVTMYSNFVAGSDMPFNMNEEEKKQNLLNFNNNNRYNQLLERLADYQLPNLRPDFNNKEKGLWLITDDNMATEYKTD